jgi:hypothetical protein
MPTQPRKHGSRGAVLVEALAVSSFLIVVLITSLFVHRAYQTKLRVMRDSRTAAWVTALKGCGRSVDPGSMGGALADLGGGENEGSASSGALETWLATDSTSDQRSERVNATRSEELGYTMNSKNSVTCNEKASDGSSVTSLFGVFAGAALKD